MTLRPFQRPLAIAERCILVWIIRTLHDVAAARHIILAVSRTVKLVGIITAVILLVALERRVDASAVGAVERTWEFYHRVGIIIIICLVKHTYRENPAILYGFSDRERLLCGFAPLYAARTYRMDRRWHDT